MFWKASAIKGYGISASDGHVGTVDDFLFDDTTWLVRWLVVDTGNWLPGRRVLLPSSALAHLDPEREEFSIKLTIQQIKDSPDVDTERSVSRQMEKEIYGHYGYNPNWDYGYGYMGGIGLLGGYGYTGGMGGAMPLSPGSWREEKTVDVEQGHDDVHLRSVKAVTGYHIHASDGEIGHVEDFLIEDADWGVRYLVVDTKNLWPGKKVLVAPRSVKQIEWDGRMVNVDATQEKVKGAPAYDSSMTIDHTYEKKSMEYYGIKLIET